MGEKDAKTGKFIPTVKSKNFVKMVGNKRLDIVLNYQAKEKAEEEKITLEEAFQKVWKEHDISMDDIAQQKPEFLDNANVKEQIKETVNDKDIASANRSLGKTKTAKLYTIINQGRKKKKDDTFEHGAGI